MSSPARLFHTTLLAGALTLFSVPPAFAQPTQDTAPSAAQGAKDDDDGDDDEGEPEGTRHGAASAAELAGEVKTASKTFTLSGYAEAFYQWNFADPSNGITAMRNFDNRHNSFTVSNAVLEAAWDFENVIGRVSLQVGHTPNTYYMVETRAPGSATAGLSDGTAWKYVQQAIAGYRFPVGRGLALEAGIFLSPIGPESVAIRENWNWSRGNLFLNLPYYHAGLRLTLPVSDTWTLSLMGCNGWNDIVDNNDDKTIMAQATYAKPGTVAVSMLYLGGAERSHGGAEGRPWRHLFDGHVTWNVSPKWTLLWHLNAGFEQNRFGTDAWFGSGLYARWAMTKKLFLAARVDVLYESVPAGATPIMLPFSWLSSGTLTFDARPHDRVSLRLEYRHDAAAGVAFFGGNVAGNGDAVAFVPNRDRQDTLTFGLATWF